MQEHTYLYVGDIMAYVKVEFGIKYTASGLRNRIQKHGFSYKKLSIVPGKANKEQQEKWLEEYEKLRERRLSPLKIKECPKRLLSGKFIAPCLSPLKIKECPKHPQQTRHAE